MKTILRNMYAKTEEKIQNKYWEIKLLIFFKLKKIQYFTKTKKRA